MSSDLNDIAPDQGVGRENEVPLLGHGPGAVTDPDAASRRRRIRSMWIFILLVIGVLAYLIYSSVSIVHDATAADYGWQQVDKPANDPKIYKYLDEVLPNGPPVVMVQDPGAQLTGFAIGVSAGFYYDPMDFAGLAHFTEHMLFLGTSKYPNPTDFDEFLSSHGGSSNAFTDSEKTVYYNAIDTDAFVDGLARFVEFFSQPTFNSTYIEKEVNAVDSEHAMHMNDVHWRMFSLVADLSLAPANHYSTGDSSTLLRGDNNTVETLEEAVRKYYSANYCFNRLSVAIVSPLAISDQIEIVRDAFSGMTSPPMALNCASATNFTNASAQLKASGGFQIPAWNRQKLVYSQAPAGVAPQLWLVFPNEPIASRGNRSKQPYSILDTIITFPGVNSFKQQVLTQGLATSVTFMYDDTSAGSLGYLSFSLSEDARTTIPSLLELAFSFFEKMRSDGGVNDTTIASLSLIRDSLFESNSADLSGSTPMRLAKFFASEMTEGVTDPNELMTRSEKILKSDPDLVNSILAGFVPENALVVIHDPEYVVGAELPDWVQGMVANTSSRGNIAVDTSVTTLGNTTILVNSTIVGNSTANNTTGSSFMQASEELSNPHYGFMYRVLDLGNSTAVTWSNSSAAANITVLRNITVLPPNAVSLARVVAHGVAPAGGHTDPEDSVVGVRGAAGVVNGTYEVLRPGAGVPASVSSTPLPQTRVYLPRVNMTQVSTPPVQIKSSNGTEIWYKDLALGGGTQKIWLWATVRPAAAALFGLSPEEVQFNGELLTDCLNAGLRSKLADFVLAGYNFGISWMFAGFFEIRVSGWAGDQVHAMVRTILAEIKSPTLDFATLVLNEKTAALSRDKSVADLAADAMNSLTVGSATTADLLTYVNTYSPITKDSLITWANTTFAQVYTTVYVAGASTDLNEAQALVLGDLFGRAFAGKLLNDANQAVFFAAGPRYVKPVEVRMANPVVTDPNSALLYTLTYGTDMSAKDRVLAALLSSILSPLVFRYIRTELQMGYIASCRTGVYPGPAGAVQLRVFIQGNQATPDMMEARLEELFISQVPGLLNALPLTEVIDRAAGLAASLQETPTSAPVEASMFWAELQGEQHCFQRTLNQAKHLEATDAATLKQGIIDVFNAFTVSRRSLVTVKLWQSPDGRTPMAAPTWYASDVAAALNNGNVTDFLSVEKSNTMFVPSVTKTVRELVFQRALNTSDPLWQPSVPTCEVV